MAPARTLKLVLAGCVLAAAAACGVHQASGAATVGAGVAAAQPAKGVSAPEHDLTFGDSHTFSDGVSITVSNPKSFQPSASAYPHTGRAAAFEIGVSNDGTQPYRLSELTVTGLVKGIPATQVVDSTQGYSGIIDAGRDIPPGKSVWVNLAFAVPSASTQLRLQLKPEGAEPAMVTFCGPA
jgi:hypothetical protein